MRTQLLLAYLFITLSTVPAFGFNWTKCLQVVRYPEIRWFVRLVLIKNQMLAGDRDQPLLDFYLTWSSLLNFTEKAALLSELSSQGRIQVLNYELELDSAAKIDRERLKWVITQSPQEFNVADLLTRLVSAGRFEDSLAHLNFVLSGLQPVERRRRVLAALPIRPTSSAELVDFGSGLTGANNDDPLAIQLLVRQLSHQTLAPSELTLVLNAIPNAKRSRVIQSWFTAKPDTPFSQAIAWEQLTVMLHTAGDRDLEDRIVQAYFYAPPATISLAQARNLLTATPLLREPTREIVIKSWAESAAFSELATLPAREIRTLLAYFETAKMEDHWLGIIAQARAAALPGSDQSELINAISDQKERSRIEKLCSSEPL